MNEIFHSKKAKYAIIILFPVIIAASFFAYGKSDGPATKTKENSPVLESVAVKSSGTDEDVVKVSPATNAVVVEDIDSDAGINNVDGENRDAGATKWVKDMIGYKKVEARTLNVPADHKKIQDAINSANRGDIVRVAEGEYGENIIMKNGVSLEGAGAQTTVIDGNNLGNTVTFKSVRDPRTYLSGFTIKNAGKSLSGISIENSSPWIHDNFITENEFGVYISGESRPVIQKNIIRNSSKGVQVYNFIEEKETGDVVSDETDDAVREDDRAVLDSGQDNERVAPPEESKTKPVIIDNLITDNKIGIDLYNSHADIEHNDISYNNHYKTYLGATYGINISGSSCEISNNIITDNGICELCAGIIADENSRNVLIGYNDIWNNKNDFLCFGECVLDENNISEDPLYADTMLGDYKLQSESALIGKAKDGLDVGIRW
ncbi:MAG: hypothetical protein WC788_07925 [Candidatus Paceibacterota bacterium]|jgi:parallel beta-helix repeat protein